MAKIEVLTSRVRFNCLMYGTYWRNILLGKCFAQGAETEESIRFDLFALGLKLGAFTALLQQFEHL